MDTPSEPAAAGTLLKTERPLARMRLLLFRIL
jgi:hypothetical protein